MKFHATISNPKGRFDARLPGLPDLDSFTKNEKERQVIDLLRAFQVPRWPHHLPPGGRRTGRNPARGDGEDFQGSRFPAGFQKTYGPCAIPLTGEEVEKAVKELPRDREVIALYKQLADAGTLPPR